MKLLTLSCATWALFAMQVLCADANYNGVASIGTGTVEEDVYIGTESGSAVTLQNGATWTVKANMYLGYNSKTSSLTVGKDAVLSMDDNNTRYLFVGAANGAHGVVTNNGTMKLSHIQLAPYAHNITDSDKADDNLGKNYRSGRFDNFGNVSVKRNLTLGAWKDDNGEMEDVAVFHNHTNATLAINRADEYGFYVGGRSAGKLVNEGSVTCPKGTKVRIGGALTSKGTGMLLQSTNATFVSGGEVRIGENSGKGAIELYDNSCFKGGDNSSDVKVGYGASSEGSIILSDNSQFVCDLFYLGLGNSSRASLSMRDNSTFSFSGDFEIARGKGATGCFELLNHKASTFNKNIYLGMSTNSTGILRLDGDTALTFEKTLRLGCMNSSTGRVELAGSSSLTLTKNFTVGSYTNENAFGEVCVSDKALFAVNGNLSVGTEDTRPGRLAVSGSGVVSATNISVAAKYGGSNQRGVLEIAENGAVTNVCEMRLGRGATSIGYCNMRGGSLFLDSTENAAAAPLTIGINATSTAGYLTGWGFVGFDDPVAIMRDYANLGRSTWGGLAIYGKITADGDGAERDLDFSRAGVNTSDGSWAGNTCRTNGWYAADKGRLVMPRSLPRIAKIHATIGDYPTLSNPRMVNSFRYDFDTATMNTTGTYVFSELYAVDRSDIPAGLPTGRGIYHSAVWRIGHFNASATPDVDDEDLTSKHKQNFSSLKLKFHYDPALAEIEDVRHVKVYRCTDTVNGGWRCVASITAPDPSSPYIETVEMAPSSELWNGGWFAVVGTPRVGTVMVLR